MKRSCLCFLMHCGHKVRTVIYILHSCYVSLELSIYHPHRNACPDIKNMGKVQPTSKKGKKSYEKKLKNMVWVYDGLRSKPNELAKIFAVSCATKGPQEPLSFGAKIVPD